MESKRQEYLSIVFRNLGFALFALFAPFGSLLFQWIVFKKDVFDGHFYFSTIIFLLGALFIVLGYIIFKGTE